MFRALSGAVARCATRVAAPAAPHAPLHAAALPAATSAPLQRFYPAATVHTSSVLQSCTAGAYPTRIRQIGSSTAAGAAEPSTAPADAPAFMIFGATGGIGAQVARQLKAKGFRVTVSGRDPARTNAVAVETGADAVAVVDPLDASAVDKAIAAAAKDMGRLDGVANCVGNVLLRGLHATSEKDFDDVVRTNLFSAFNVSKGAIKTMMKSGGGSVVLFSSAVAKHGLPNHEAIAAAKAGVEGLMKSSAATYAPKNIRVNCVAPGLTRTGLAEKITSSEPALKASTAMHALGRIGEADEVARAAVFLLDPANSFITGQVLGVDGGLGSVKSQG
ncbi:unnamed protein product [Pedinophyceae sp. YPF-701]|nr:unnamed protein product [Pedinophyceae sp. YPF-701]